MNETLIISGYGERQKSSETRFRLRPIVDKHESNSEAWYACGACQKDEPIIRMYSAALCRECHAKENQSEPTIKEIQENCTCNACSRPPCSWCENGYKKQRGDAKAQKVKCRVCGTDYGIALGLCAGCAVRERENFPNWSALRAALCSLEWAEGRKPTVFEATGLVPSVVKPSRVGQLMKLSEMPVGTTFEATGHAWKMSADSVVGCAPNHRELPFFAMYDNAYEILAEPVVEVGDKVKLNSREFVVTRMDTPHNFQPLVWDGAAGYPLSDVSCIIEKGIK